MGPLHGIKILEFSGIGPGPYCGMLLADLGADVIRLSRIDQKGSNNKYDIHNRSKRSIVADLKNPKTLKEIRKLIQEMDVMFEGYRPGVMEKLGLGPKECLKLNKSLVYGRMTGWGQDGPMSRMAGHDINYISLSGALNAIGSENSKPSIPLNLIGDYGGGGMMLAMGILAAVISSSRTGKGQVIDSAMIDGSLSLMSFFYSLQEMGIWKDKRQSNFLDGAAHFYDTYECSDKKFIAVGSIEPQFYKILLEKLELNAQVCSEICVPVNHKFNLSNINYSNNISSSLEKILLYNSTVPKLLKNNQLKLMSTVVENNKLKLSFLNDLNIKPTDIIVEEYTVKVEDSFGAFSEKVVSNLML